MNQVIGCRACRWNKQKTWSQLWIDQIARNISSRFRWSPSKKSLIKKIITSRIMIHNCISSHGICSIGYSYSKIKNWSIIYTNLFIIVFSRVSNNLEFAWIFSSISKFWKSPAILHETFDFSLLRKSFRTRFFQQ